MSFGLAVLLCVLISIPLLISGSLKRSPAPGAEESRAPGSEEPLPEGLYIPFGPFLTASAVLIAFAPLWVWGHASLLWQWWMHLLARGLGSTDISRYSSYSYSYSYSEFGVRVGVRVGVR